MSPKKRKKAKAKKPRKVSAKAEQTQSAPVVIDTPKVGRPSDYSPEMAERICMRMAEGESVRSICRDPAFPVISTVMLWRLKHEEFSEQYARAREMMLEVRAEEIIEIADDGTNDFVEIETKNGKKIVFDREHVQRSTLRVEARKWELSKLLPKYRDKVDLTHRAPSGGPVEFLLGELRAPGTESNNPPSAEAHSPISGAS